MSHGLSSFAFIELKSAGWFRAVLSNASLCDFPFVNESSTPLQRYLLSFSARLTLSIAVVIV